MSLTFTDWENCTDDATAQEFLLNWTANTGMVPYTHLEAIRQAIAERYVAAGLSLTGVLASPLAYGSSGTYAIAHAIDTAITALIPAYVNHTDNGGDWDGQTTCAPVWTSATILAAIGAASRILVGNLGTPLSAAWARQVYALLRMMRWRKETGLYNPPMTGTYQPLFVNNSGGNKGTGWKGSWAVAVTTWNSLSWTSGAYFQPRGESYLGPGYYITRTFSSYRITNRRSIAAVIDGYERYGVSNNCIFENLDNSYLQNQYIKVGSSGVLAPLGYEDIGTFGEFNTVPTTEPDLGVGLNRGWIFDMAARTGIYKFNIPGGFTFQ